MGRPPLTDAYRERAPLKIWRNAPILGPMKRVALTLIGALTVLAAPGAAGAALPATPPCPQVEGWSPAGTFGPIDNGNAVEFECLYSLPGQPQQLTLDVHWYKPTARDVDVDYSECGKASSGGSYYTDIYGGTNIVHEEYVVNSGTAAGNAAVFQAEQQHIQQAAQVLLTATEALAKSCTPSASAPPIGDTTPPTVHVAQANGRAGTNIAFRFTVGDDSGHVNVVLTIFRGRSSRKALLNKNYGTASAQSSGNRYIAWIHARNRGNYLWCVTATDAAGNKAVACTRLVVR
jgi:hypothetical protein